MGTQPSPGGDELRARHYLARLSARPLGHQEPTMDNPAPITPTRIIPAGAPLPARAPEPGEVPPWRSAPPPAPGPAAPPPSAMRVHVTHTHVHVLPDEEPDPPRLWERLWDRLWATLVTWRMLAAILAALLPWVGGRSPVGLWSETVYAARTEASPMAAYVIAGVALAAAWTLDRRTGRVVPRALFVTALIGSTGALHWWDPIHALTGVAL